MEQEQQSDVGLLRSLAASVADAIISRGRLANVAGRTYGGARDLYEVAGYTRDITPAQYRSRYRRNAVAKRVVECAPIDTWRGGFGVFDEKDSDKDTDFEKTYAALDDRLKIATVLRRADILAGIGRYAVVFIGAPGAVDTPLTSVKADDIVFLECFAEEDAPIQALETNEKSPRFGMPTFYNLKRTTQLSSQMEKVNLNKRVHHTRILHIADGLLDDRIFGTPRLECCWNLLDDLEKVTSGGAESFWMRANQGMHIDIDASLNPSAEELQEMRDNVEKYRHRMERVLRTRGAKINTLGSDVADLKGPQAAITEQISAGIGIPTRVLMGSEQGKLAADQDSVKYYRQIESRRIDFAENQVVRPFIQRLIDLTALPAPKENTFYVFWAQIKTRDDDEKATIAQKWAQVNSTAGQTVVTVDEIRERCLDLDSLEDVDAEAAAANKNAGSPPDPGGLPARDGGLPGGNPEPRAASLRKEGSSWKKVHRAADRFRPRLQEAAKDAFTQGKVVLNPAKLKAALKEGNEKEVLALASGAILAVANTLRPVLEEIYDRVLTASGNAAARALRQALRANESRRDLADDFAFDRTSPDVLEWIQENAAETITGISETTRQAIKDLVEEAFTEQYDVDELADEIGSLIGDEDRAEAIARTETMKASNAGQQEAWAQAVDEGLLTGDEGQEWIVTPDDRLCPICEPMDGKKAPLGGTFSTELGEVDGPPAHPRCRCTIAIGV